MKRFFLIVLSLLLCTLGSGCAGEKGGNPSAVSSEGAKPLRVLIDIAYTDSEAANSLKKYPVEKSYRSFEEALEEKGGIADVAVETLPGVGKDMTEREARLTNLRTEIMAGAGPDVYICPTQNDYQVFPYPRQAIEQELFLALDDYLPKAQFTDMEAFSPALAEAGQYEGKQYLLPLAFTLPVTLFRESEVQHELSDAMTWEDMLQGDAALRAAASISYARLSHVNSYRQVFALLPLEAEGRLTFSEEELLEFIRKEESLYQELEQDPEVPDYGETTLSRTSMFDKRNLAEGLQDCEDFTAIPVYSQKGGYGALITSFAAVNANTERPEDAFFVVDYLQSEEFQNSDILKKSLTGENAVPALAAQSETAVCTGLRSHLQFAEFNTPLVSVAGDLIADVRSKATGVENPERYSHFRKIERTENLENKTTEEIVREVYSRLEKMLAES